MSVQGEVDPYWVLGGVENRLRVVQSMIRVRGIDASYVPPRWPGTAAHRCRYGLPVLQAISSNTALGSPSFGDRLMRRVSSVFDLSML